MVTSAPEISTVSHITLSNPAKHVSTSLVSRDGELSVPDRIGSPEIAKVRDSGLLKPGLLTQELKLSLPDLSLMGRAINIRLWQGTVFDKYAPVQAKAEIQSSTPAERVAQTAAPDARRMYKIVGEGNARKLVDAAGNPAPPEAYSEVLKQTQKTYNQRLKALADTGDVATADIPHLTSDHSSLEKMRATLRELQTSNNFQLESQLASIQHLPEWESEIDDLRMIVIDRAKNELLNIEREEEEHANAQVAEITKTAKKQSSKKTKKVSAAERSEQTAKKKELKKNILSELKEQNQVKREAIESRLTYELNLMSGLGARLESFERRSVLMLPDEAKVQKQAFKNLVKDFKKMKEAKTADPATIRKIADGNTALRNNFPYTIGSLEYAQSLEISQHLLASVGTQHLREFEKIGARPIDFDKDSNEALRMEVENRSSKLLEAFRNFEKQETKETLSEFIKEQANVEVGMFCTNIESDDSNEAASVTVNGRPSARELSLVLPKLMAEMVSSGKNRTKQLMDLGKMSLYLDTSSETFRSLVIRVETAQSRYITDLEHTISEFAVPVPATTETRTSAIEDTAKPKRTKIVRGFNDTPSRKGLRFRELTTSQVQEILHQDPLPGTTRYKAFEEDETAPFTELEPPIAEAATTSYKSYEEPIRLEPVVPNEIIPLEHATKRMNQYGIHAGFREVLSNPEYHFPAKHGLLGSIGKIDGRYVAVIHYPANAQRNILLKTIYPMDRDPSRRHYPTS